MHVPISYERPSELIPVTPFTTMPVSGNNKPEKLAMPASVIFLQYDMSKNEMSLSFEIDLIAWSSTAFSHPESYSSCKLRFCLSNSWSAETYNCLQSQKSTLTRDFSSLKASAKNWLVIYGILLRLNS